MGYVNDLRQFLHQLDRRNGRKDGEEGSVGPCEERGQSIQVSGDFQAISVDIASHQCYLVDRFEALEKRAASESERDAITNTARWCTADDYFELFIIELAREFGRAFSRAPDEAEMRKLLQIMVSNALENRLPQGGTQERVLTIRDTQLKNLVERVIDRAELALADGQWRLIDRYAFEVRLTRVENAQAFLGAPGKVLLELTGWDAVRWLLSLEVLQSMGPTDNWRMSRETAETLLRYPLQRLLYARHEDEQSRALADTVTRLAAFGLMALEQTEQELKGYRLLERGCSLLKELVNDKETPFSVLARALIEDETSHFFESRLGSSRFMPRGLAAEANTRHARMVAHEVRNALVPVKTALSALYREAGESSEAVDRYRRRIDDGIDRIFTFAEEQLRVTSLVPGGGEPFDALTALHDAVAAAREESATTVAFDTPRSAGLPLLSGTRSRFVMAITNLLRNAAQAVKNLEDARIELRLLLEDESEELQIIVDDNGPGVPAGSRRAIYENGFSGRPGGSGHGLALVREVIESEMNGRVVCEDSPLGGARFRLRLPLSSRRKP
jgi:signal transduction histidine kinase